MLIAKTGNFFRRLFQICLICVVLVDMILLVMILTTPSPSAESLFTEAFISSMGGAAGAVVGNSLACYVVDAAIAPIAPPVALALAGACPAIGNSIGGIIGFGATGAAVAQH
jgi:hypothetical protein